MEVLREVAKRLEESSPQLANTTSENPMPSSRTECESCGGEGWVPSGGMLRPCLCQRERAIQRELPPRYRYARLADFPVESRAQIGRWFKTPGDGLLLFGAVGSGKTHLAAAIARDRMEQGERVQFRRLAEFYAALRESYRLNMSETEVLQPYVAAPLIVLDDLGAGGLTDFERRATLEILDQRLNHMRPTVVTTNLELGEIADKMDDRIASRLAMYTNIRLAGADRRLAATATGGQ